jgi:hypothetical protein
MMAVELDEATMLSEMAPEPTPEPEKPSVTGMTVAEMSGSMTGFEEVAVEKQFGPLGSHRGTMAARALVFIYFSRSMSADDAYQRAMEIPQGAIDGYFDEDDEITPDTPTTESGKGSGPAVSAQTT